MGNKKKKSILDVQSIIDENKLDFKIIEYNGYIKNNKFQHSCGEVFETRLSHLLNRKRCPKCHGKKRDKEVFQIKSNDIHNSEYEILEFSNGNLPVKMKHKICGNIFEQVGHRHLRGNRCPKCYRSFKLSKEDIIKRSNRLWNNEYEIISEKVEYDKKAKIKHKTCGYEYDQMTYSHLLGVGCPKCAGNKKHTKETVQEKSNKIHNNEYEILSNVKNVKSKIRIKHKLCGREYSQKVDYHISGRMCPYCSSSKGEKNIESILLSKNVDFTKQKTFDDCKFKNKLRFDFYIPDIKTCIEFDGIQHYEPCWYFGGKKAFELQKIKDNIKNEYCEKNNINLVRFRFDDKNEFIELKINELIYTINEYRKKDRHYC